MKTYRILIVAFSLTLASLCMAQTGQEKKKTASVSAEKPAAHTVVAPEAINWLPFVLPGTEIAVLSGDPAKPGPFVIRIKLHAELKVPPHWHPTDEHITIITGKAVVGMGEKFDLASGQEIAAGSYALLPKKMAHFIYAKEETITQVHGIGPFKVIWVNPADDPTKKAGGK